MSHALAGGGAIRFSKLYVASSRVSHAVVRSKSRDELFGEVTRILVEDGGYAMALLAWHDSSTHELIPVACFGDTHGYAARARMFTDDRPEGQGPAGTAFRTGEPYICDDFLSDPKTSWFREAALGPGWRASAAFPISVAGSPRALLSVYARELGAFDAGHVELLREVALDVSLGLERFEGEERRRAAEAALSNSEQRLRHAMSAAAMGTFEWDLRTGQLIWDRQSQRLFGFEPGEFEGTYASFERAVHPEDVPALHRAIRQARESRSAYSHEFRIFWPDGTLHWVMGQGEFRYTDSGEPYRMYGTAMDVTGRKRVEAAQRESEQRLQQALRVSDIGIFDHDHLTGAIYWSPRQRQIHGVAVDEPANLAAYYRGIHPDDLARIRDAVKSAHDPAGDGLFDVEHRLIRPDGSIRWTSTRSQTFFAGEGAARRPVRTVGAVRDVTELHRAQEEQNRLSTLVARSRDFIGIATLEGQVFYLNQAALDLVGLGSIGEISDKNMFDFAPQHRNEVNQGIYAELLRVGYWTGDAQLQHFKTGVIIDVEMNAFQICDDNGAPLYIAAHIRDIRERKRAEAEREKLWAQLAQSQKMESVGLLAGGIAHDFNNLLTVINGYSKIALSKLRGGDPLWRFLEEILRAGERAAALTGQLLAFSRKQVLQPQLLQINRVVLQMEPMLQRLMGDDVALAFELSPADPAIRADRHQIEQVIMNLAVNARDAMPEGGKLLIATGVADENGDSPATPPHAASPRWVTFSVSDTGAGMDPDTLQRIWEPFFTTKPVGQGTGLGLSMVQGIVAQSGGFVNVHSTPGSGTAFKIHLPAFSAAGSQPEDPAMVEDVRGRETVLVVEDHPDVRRYTATVLREYGYRVLEASNPGEALLACELETARIDLLLTDLVMPNMSGVKLAQRLTSLRTGLKTLFMSGHIGAGIAHTGEFPSPANFIQKPFTPEALARKVRECFSAPAAGLPLLVADDSAEVRQLLADMLRESGYSVAEASDREQLLERFRGDELGLALVDLGMLRGEAAKTIQEMRSVRPAAKIVLISGYFGNDNPGEPETFGVDAVLGKSAAPERLLDLVRDLLAG